METSPPVIDTIIIETTRMVELAEFYRQGFNLSLPESHGDDHLGFRIGSVYLGFDLVTEAGERTPGPVSVWFRVSDLQGTYDRFLELGAQSMYPPTKKPWGDTLAAVFDLDGNVIGLAQL